MYYVLRPKIVLMLCNLCLMYCISTNLPGPPRHVNHRGEDYYKSATSYSTLCTAPTTKGNAYNAATTIVLDSAAAATYDRLPPKPTGPFDTKKPSGEGSHVYYVTYVRTA